MSTDVRKYTCGLDPGDHPRAITAALKSLAGRGADLSDVLLSMRTATIEANVYHYNTAISTCHGPLWQCALHLLLRMSLHLVRADAVSQNAAMAAVGPLWQRGANLFRDSDKEGVAFNSMLSSLSKVGNWELGQSALKEMRCCLVQADHISFTACLDASGRADQWRRSWFLLKQLQTSLRADVVAWNCAISGGRGWQRALEVVAAVPWHALQLDAVSYDSAISRCTGKWQHASSLMGSSGLRASLVTYHAAMTAFEAPGWRFAIGFLQGIGSQRLLPEVLTYNSAATACQKALRWLQASGVLRSMDASGLQGDSYTCSAVLGACRGSWALAVELVSGMCRSDLPPNAIVFNALASACGLAGQWQLALRSLDAVGDCFTYAAAISACEKAHEWQRALWLLYQMPGVCLKADAVCFAAAISACEKGQRWQHAICVFSAMKTYRLEPALLACNALISALEKCSCWQLALSLLISVGIDADIVTFNAALGACAKAAWPFALELFEEIFPSKLEPDAVSYNVVIGACERSSQWEAVLALLREESSTFGKMLADLCAPSSGTITSLLDLESKSNSDLCHLIWRFAKLAQAALFDVDIRCITRAATTVLAAAVRRDLDLSEISTFLWSLAVLGVDGPGVRRLIVQLRKRLAAGQEKVLPLKLLGNVIWAVAMMKDLELLVLQKEMVARSKMDFWQTLDFSSAALEVLWASAFVQRLPIQVEASLSESVRRVAGELDRRPSPALSSPATSPGPQLDGDSESPRILRRYSDRVVVYKPPGWQVDDALADRRWPLSSWLHTALDGQQNLLEDLQHRRGFIHRLDVPTSGLVLVATSYSAYYDMQLQLMTRRMKRQYLVLCHGWLGARTQIEARIHSLEDGPSWYRSSRISSVGGRPSATLLEPVAYATMDEKAFTLTDFQIVTGRRHQIRVHTAHCGYPTMSDARYTAEATFKDDSSRCARNFLHRYRLKFEVADMAQRYQEVEEQLPQDLANVLDLLEPVSVASAQGIRSSRP